jgi:arabinofuranosyltransferase
VTPAPGMPPSPSARLRPADGLVALSLLALLGWYVRVHLDTGGRPEEDAAMLLRYAKHLAEGRGIVWNVGEPPLDGATDFLFMLKVALAHRLGVSLEAAARGIGLAAHAATVLLVYLGARRLHGAGPAWALVPAAFLAVGPGLRHLAAGYGTPLFALAATVAWLAATRLAEAAEGRAARPALAFALAALAMGLARPEGVFLGGFMLLAVLLARGGRDAAPILGRFLLVFGTLGLAYFLWRWHYFGHPLPNPFYKKGGGVLYWHTLRMSWRDLWRLGLPLVALLPLGLLVRGARRAALFASVPVLLFVGVWVLMSNETNYVMRFRYPILPVILLGCVPVGRALAEALRSALPALPAPPAAARWAAALVLAGLLAHEQHQAFRWVAPRRMGLYDAALVLRDYAPRGFTLVTTEAGLLPLYSGWRAVDAWGLNDRHVAHRGTIDEAYLDRYRPEVIVAHAYFSPGVPDHGPRVENRSLGPRWYRMVMTLKGYAESRGYVLAACFGRNAWDTHYYWVRTGFHQSAEIVARLRALDYGWDGEPTIDFAAPHGTGAVDAGEAAAQDPAVPDGGGPPS